MADELLDASLATLTEWIRRGRYSPVEVVETYLDRIDRLDDDLNAFVTVTPERARAAAREAERELRDGSVGPLHGVPVAIKDSRAVAGVPLTWGTELLADNVPEEDDDVVTRLRDAGAIVVGKTNLPAFQLMGGTHNRFVGATANPFDHERMVGGSSGGSAAAVAAGLVPIAQGEDGGGSLRMPASSCGVYTIKPTFGRVGEYSPGRTNAFGHTPMAAVGPLARRVADAAVVLDVLAGPHPRDPFSLPAQDVCYREAIHDPVAGLDVACSPDLGLYPIDPAVRATVEDAADALADAGATVHHVDPAFEHGREAITNAFMLQANVGTTAFGDALRAEHGIDVTGEHRDAIFPYLVEQFEAGRDTTALEYRAADEVRTAVFDALQALLAEYDLLLSASLLVPPFEADRLLEAPGPAEIDGTRLDDSRWGTLIDWRTTQITNMTGHPAASIPAGFVDGLPVGMEIVGPRFDEATVLAASETVERLRPWADQYDRLP
jgi:Asp-tRNA(Asn)/Glu-tRNA(Gln) amidotransferase A subunit family amidase